MHQRYHTFDISPSHFISELENSSLKKQIEKYILENSSLQQQLNELETEIEIKGRLLDQKSKHIINVTSENLCLKQDIKVLKKQLHIKNKSTLLNKKRRKKLGKHLININKTVNVKTELLFSDLSSIYSDEHIQLPYLVPTMAKSVSELSECSNLSEQACILSFPKTPQDSNPQPYMPKTYTPSILSPIAENKCDMDELHINDNNIFIKISDDNMNIENDEWVDCIVNISPPKLNMLSGDDSSSMSSYKSNDTIDSCDAVSYMSDNTVLLMDMNFSKNKLNSYDEYDHSNSDCEILAEKRGSTESIGSNTQTVRNNCGHQMMYKQVSCDQLMGCDTVITSPICSILESKKSKNLLVNLNLNSDNFTIVDVESNSDTKFKFK